MRILTIMLAAVAATLAPALAAATDVQGRWRVTHGRPAPWLDAALADRPRADLVGARVDFGKTAVKGPVPLDCGGARYEPTLVPAEGLFQGGLAAARADADAARLGLVGGPFAGFSLTCDAGMFEFHRADADTLLFALDNVVWTMSRAHGARAARRAPEAAVQAFLERHFGSAMAFAPQNVAALRPLLTTSLAAAIDAYFARPSSPETAPVIDGDAFTDTQEYPTRFAVRKGERGRVPVDFADGYQTRRVVYAMKSEGGAWRLDDLFYEDGARLRETMLMSPD